MVQCSELDGPDLVDYASGGLDPPARERFDAHVASCRACAERVRREREIVGLARRAFAGRDDAGSIPEHLVHSILAARRSPVETSRSAPASNAASLDSENTEEDESSRPTRS
jgi:anti-sigma factor RsiW